MRSDIQFHTNFFYRTELIQNLGDILSLFYSYLGVEGDSFDEEVDYQDKHDEQYPSSESDFLLFFCHDVIYQINVR